MYICGLRMCANLTCPFYLTGKDQLGLASCVSFSCATPSWPDSEASRTIKVEVLVHCSNKIWLETLAWLDPVLHTQIVKFEWSNIQRGQGKTYYAIPPSKGSLRRPRWTCLWPAKDSRPQWCLAKKGWPKALVEGANAIRHCQCSRIGRHSSIHCCRGGRDVSRRPAQHQLQRQRLARRWRPGAENAKAGASTDAERCRGPCGSSGRFVGAAAAAECGGRQHTGGPRCRFNVRSISLKITKFELLN